MIKKTYILVSILIVMTILLSGCDGLLTMFDRTVDTRQYIDTIGVVFTNEAVDVINELYVFPSSGDGTDVFEQDMGPDMIKNTGEFTRIGSFGVTVEIQGTHYNVMARGRQQDIFIFRNVPLTNVCEAVLSFNMANWESSNPFLTVYHKNGAVDVVEGRYVAPGDAPLHTHNPLRTEVPIRFTIANSSDHDLMFVSMREADNPDKGEVELYVGLLEAGNSYNVSIRLPAEDEEITEWILNVEVADGVTVVTREVFNPWDIETLTFAMEDNMLVFTVS
jgi:hypothetical protein